MNTLSSLCFGPVHLKLSYPVTQCPWHTHQRGDLWVSLSPCFGWDGVTCLHNSQYNAMFWMKIVLVTHWYFSCFWAVLTALRTFHLLMMPCQWGVWGCTRNWEGTHPGKLIPTVQRGILYHMTSWSTIWGNVQSDDIFPPKELEPLCIMISVFLEVAEHLPANWK